MKSNESYSRESASLECLAQPITLLTLITLISWSLLCLARRALVLEASGLAKPKLVSTLDRMLTISKALADDSDPDIIDNKPKEMRNVWGGKGSETESQSQTVSSSFRVLWVWSCGMKKMCFLLLNSA